MNLENIFVLNVKQHRITISIGHRHVNLHKILITDQGLNFVVTTFHETSFLPSQKLAPI